jgi:hypothetical protein
MADYDKIMEFIEKKFIGQSTKVSVRGEGNEELVYTGKLNDAAYIIKGSGALVKRVPADKDVYLISLKFDNLEIKLSGYELDLGKINLKSSKAYILSSNLDRPLLVELEKI